MSKKEALKQCINIFKKYKLKNQTDLVRFLKKNHPDKPNFKNLSPSKQDDVNTIVKCFGIRKKIYEKPEHTKTPSVSAITKTPSLKSLIPDGIIFPEVKKEKSYSKKKYECIRKHSNFANILKEFRFDKPTFDRDSLLRAIPFMAPKIEAIFNKIDELDTQDMQKEGKLYKHFIFSDVKTQGYGAKILASCFIAKGYNLVFDNRLKMKKSLPKGNKNFGVLSSTALYNKPFTTRLKKNILSTFNQRPENINGENIRFIILDSGFKEGIDLFDVKYVHLFEPPLNTADLKQAVGRATRTCGQKGLTFVPGKGIKLNVFTYDLDLNQIEDTKYDSAYQALLAHSKINLSLMRFTEELNKVSINSAIDFELTYNINSFSRSQEEKKIEALRDLRNEVPLQIENQIGGMLRTTTIFECANAEICGKRSTKRVPFNNKEMEIVYRSLGFKMPTNRSLKRQNIRKRQFFCNEILRIPEFCSALKQLQLNPALLNVHIQKLIELRKKRRKRKIIKPEENQLVPYLSDKYALVPYTKGDPVKTEDGAIIPYLSPSGETPESPIEEDENQELVLYNNLTLTLESPEQENQSIARLLVPKQKTAKQKRKGKDKALWDKFTTLKNARRFVRKNFAKFKWEKPIIRDECNVKDNKKRDEKYTLINYHETQNFVRHYFTPYSPYKGLLLWHSVGTGKTCAAVATATTTYEKMGYTIIFVTRTTLKSDIWKNVFKMVCSETVRDKLKAGEKITGNLLKDKRNLLGNNWFEPMSYKQFSNAMAGKNKLYHKLVQRNGKRDPLRKTLLVIDEAHKLYGGDLKGAEKPAISEIEEKIFNSYSRSGNNSVKLLLMTATPITNDAMELVKLLNLMIHPQNDRFPTSYSEFQEKYLNEEGMFESQEKKRNFMDKIGPYISYLSRESDPRKFAIPEFNNVSVSVFPDDYEVYESFEDMPEYIDNLQKLEDEMNEIDEDTELLVQRRDLIIERKNRIEQSIPARLRDVPKDKRQEVKDNQKLVKDLKKEEKKLDKEIITQMSNRTKKLKKDLRELKKQTKKRFIEYAKRNVTIPDVLVDKKCNIQLVEITNKEKIRKRAKTKKQVHFRTKAKTKTRRQISRFTPKYSKQDYTTKVIKAIDVSSINEEINSLRRYKIGKRGERLKYLNNRIGRLEEIKDKLMV